MLLLHTSDWHLGRTLHGQKRYEEQQAFLDWLAQLIASERVEVLAVAGDIFDNTAPSNRAQEQYYRFLWQAAASGCRHIFITGGNHDSPSLLNAPRQLLRSMNIHVIGSALDNPADEVFLLNNQAGEAGMIICAVPYLRDRDLRVAEAGESAEDKERKLLEGIRRHYCEACDRAEQIQAEAGRNLPVVAMGHLFATGGQVESGDGVRELYVGSLARVERTLFPESIDYLALGHLHTPQQLGGFNNLRYSGAPLAMNFGERAGSKTVCLVSFNGRTAVVRPVEVPEFQPLVQLVGSLAEIEDGINRLKSESSSAWLEVIYEGTEHVSNLREVLDEATAGSELRVLAIKNRQMMGQVRWSGQEREQLEDLDPLEVFRRCMDQRQVPAVQRAGLMEAYQAVLADMQDEDINAL